MDKDTVSEVMKWLRKKGLDKQTLEQHQEWGRKGAAVKAKRKKKKN